jgi:hypothetical protein
MAKAVNRLQSSFMRKLLCLAAIGAIGFLLNAHLVAAMGVSLIFASGYLRSGNSPGA